MEKEIFSKHRTLNFAGKLTRFDSPKIMGIMNITDDSFYDGGFYDSEVKIFNRIERMLAEGCDIIDIGAQSTRSGAKEIGVNAEMSALKPIINTLRKLAPEAIISVDTYHSSVAQMVIDLGANMINDISGGNFDENMHKVIANANIPYVLMHTSGKPSDMQQLTQYKDIVEDMIYYFSEKLRKLNMMGVSDVIIDPGFGFGKTVEQNYYLLKNLEHFAFLERMILVGISRKSMIYKALETNAESALNGTTALNMIALIKGADILRVHDVKEAKEVVKLFENYTKSAI